ncbi:hypothetical protein MKEN_00203400 [Mycena kentingensis (nom. inval.)]|nr:hypothetical protein MKEN_00203400 [Mycena kentingensis (nom. inval.)]
MPGFFTRYHTFEHDPHAPIRGEFNRLARQFGWDKDLRRRKWVQCAEEEFGFVFGGGGRASPTLAKWHAMLEFCGVDDYLPASVGECKKIIRDEVFVNIFDMLDAKRTGGALRKHDSKEELKEYFRRTGKIFPLANAKENVFLAVLLIKMF